MPAPRSASRPDATLAVGAAGMAGVLGPAAWGLGGELGVIAGRFRADAGVLWMAPADLSLAPGRVREELLAGSARACHGFLRTEVVRLDACAGALAGATSARATGYTRNEQRTRAWVAIPVGLDATVWTRLVGWGLGVAALFPVTRSDFGVDGVGTAYRSPAVGGLATLSILGIGRGWL